MHSPELGRRALLAGAGAAAALVAAPRMSWAAEPPIASLTAEVVPISPAERLARIEKAQRLMREHRLGAILVEPGASLFYFTGIVWNRSERLTAAIIAARGETIIVTPFFEEPSVRESLAIPAEIRTWQEDESVWALIAGALADRGVKGEKLGIEETVRFFAFDGLGPHDIVLDSAVPVVRGCRMIKSPTEIALMQKAADVTIAAYRHVAPRIAAGMTPADIGTMMADATRTLGGRHLFALILLGEASAYPHGTAKPQAVREGEVVLMDCGCSVEGYQSDISRSFVFGAPTTEQRRVWSHMRQGQNVAFRAARIGTPAGAVDDAVRRFYEGKGYGPRYRLPGLSHRTGHGIGLDGHEPVNFVHGETTRLAPGMCFSNEPGLYLPGKFGIRLEDCLYMTEAGPRWFSTPPPSLERAFA